MIPEPLHPALVHFPIVLMFMIPIAAAVALVQMRNGQKSARGAWVTPFLFATALALAAFFAVRTGAAQEERVEDVVSENAIHTHEEAAETFLIASLVLLAVMAGGLVRGTFGQTARFLGAAGSVAVIALGVRTGGSGGELVYRHGAAAAYAEGGAQPSHREDDEKEEGAALIPSAVLLVSHLESLELPIPRSIREEHQEIHTSLVNATKKPGAVGAAARDVAAILHAHFEREEQIALPPLGLLRPLAQRPPARIARLREVLPMTDSLNAELPRMLREHVAIRAAVQKMGEVAKANGDKETEQLAHRLASHALQEEEVLYPAAVVVGVLARDRLKNRVIN